MRRRLVILVVAILTLLADVHRLDVISLIATMTYADVMEFAAPET
jgi:hypothetical protein